MHAKLLIGSTHLTTEFIWIPVECYLRTDVTIYPINPFPHTANLQQTTLNTSSKKYGNCLSMSVLLWNIVEIIVPKVESARYDVVYL